MFAINELIKKERKKASDKNAFNTFERKRMVGIFGHTSKQL